VFASFLTRYKQQFDMPMIPNVLRLPCAGSNFSAQLTTVKLLKTLINLVRHTPTDAAKR
jgi:hypothetical protein